MYSKRENFYESEIFKKITGKNSNSTENSEKENLTESNTGTNNENKNENKEGIESQESLNSNSTKEVLCIEISNCDNSDSQVHETIKLKDKSKGLHTKKNKKIYKKKMLKNKENNKPKDARRIEICKMSMNSAYRFLNHRCKIHKLCLKKIDGKKYFGNAEEKSLLLNSKLKDIFSENFHNKKVIEKMIKKDLVFKKFVNLEFEEYYRDIFLFKEVNKEKIYLVMDRKTDFKFKVLNFDNFETCLKNYVGDNKAELRKIGYNFINDIKG
jgi:hypothetical protein